MNKACLTVVLVMAGCVERLAPPDDAPGHDRSVAGTWTRTALRDSGWGGTRYAGALALTEDGVPAVVTGENHSVLRWTFDGATWRDQSLQYDPNVSILGGQVAAAALPDGSTCAAWSWGYDHSLVLSCGAASAMIPNVWLVTDLAVAVDSAGGAWVAWSDGSAVRVRAPNGTLEAVPSVPGAGFDLALGPDDRPHVATTSGSEVWLAERSATGTWSSAFLAARSGDNTFRDSVAMAVSPTGRVAVAYSSTFGQLKVWEDGVVSSVAADYTYGVGLAYGAGDALHVAWATAKDVRIGAFDHGALGTEVLTTSALELPSGGLDLRLDRADRPSVLSTNFQNTIVFQRSAPMVEADPPAVRALGELAAGDLVITEFMANPGAVSDDVGESIEVANPGALPVDLDGLIVEDESGHRGAIAGSVVLDPGEHAVLGRTDPTRFAPASVAPAAFYGTEPALNNTGDRVRILGTNGLLDETFRYGSAQAVSGASWQLSAGALDAVSNDAASAWCRSTDTYEGQERGTPGEPNDDCSAR